MAIHGDLLLEAWMDPGNPGKLQFIRNTEDLTRLSIGEIAISQLSTHGYWSKFLVVAGGMPFHTNQFELGTLDSVMVSR